MNAEPTTAEQEEEERAELVTFQVKSAYVYIPLPPATSYGHRAELWNVEKWFKEVRLKVVTAGDRCWIRLEDQDTAELFAECPLPSDGSPLTRRVEPVVDSSRYYVLQVVDRTDAKKHAFLGIGFGERGESSAFSAALDDYRQYLRRKAEAAALRESYESRNSRGASSSGTAAAAGDGVEPSAGSASSPVAPGQGGSQYAIAPGQTISIKLNINNNKQQRSGSGQQDGGSSSGSGTPQQSSSLTRNSIEGRRVTRVFSLNETIAGIRISPPPSAASGTLTGALSSAGSGDWAVFSDSPRPTSATKRDQQQQQQRERGRNSSSGPLTEEEWGDFQSNA